MKKLSFFLVVITIFSNLFCAEVNLTEKQKAQLISNLNYLQYSTEKIRTAENKIIAADEFYHVINDFNFSTYNDSNLEKLFSNFKNSCRDLNLTQREKDFIIELSKKESKNAIYKAFSNYASIFIPGRSWKQIGVQIAYATIGNVTAVLEEKNNVNIKLAKQLFALDQDIVRNVYNMESQLDDAARKMLGNQNYAGLVKQNGMNEFVKYIGIKNPKERLTALNEKTIKDRFSFFPPYWYELGNAYQENGMYNEALNCYDTFEQLKKTDVLDTDYTYVKVLRNKISILLGDDSAKILDNAIINRGKIRICLDTMEKQYLPSEIGEKKSYFSKIYYIIGDYDKSYELANSLIQSKTLYPEYLEEAIQLKRLLEMTRDTEQGLFHQYAYTFSSISFGTNINDAAAFFNETKTGFVNSAKETIPFIKNPDKNYSFEFDEVNFLDDKHLYISLPSQLLDDNSIYITIDDVIYAPKTVTSKTNTNEVILFFDYKLGKVKEALIFDVHLIPRLPDSREKIVTYKLQKIDEHDYNAAAKAYERIGSDINVHVAETAIALGKIMKEYKYTVKDTEEEIQKIRKEEEKLWKKGRLDVQSSSDFEAKVSEKFNKKNNIDLDYIQSRVKANEEEFYKSTTHVLYDSKITKYDNNFYMVGIDSIYNTDINKAVYFDANSDLYYIDSLTPETVPLSLNEYYQLALSGNISGMVNLGISYYDGLGTPVNYRESLKWLLRAVNVKNLTPISPSEKIELGKAYKYLGHAYENGYCVSKNNIISKEWYKKADEAGIEIDKKYLK